MTPREPSTRSAPPRARRRSIAVLIDQLDHFTGGFEGSLRAALQRTAEVLDFNLLVVPGFSIDAPDASGRARNGVYDLVGASSVDGLVLVSASLAFHTGMPGLRRFCERHRDLPMCSLGLLVPGVPSVSFDDRAVMREIVEHLIEVHGCERIAFIGGPRDNPDARSRLAVCEDVLLREALVLEPRLVAHGQFTVETGANAMREILEQNLPFDAVVSANDGMALGALEVLAARGLRVPRDVIVTGFDDLPLARFASPPLTTVRQPLAQMAAIAGRLVLDQSEGGVVPLSTVVSAELVTRASCGCDLQATAYDVRRAGPPVSKRLLAEKLARLEPRLDGDLFAHSPGMARRLVDALAYEIDGVDGAFRAAFEPALHELGSRYELYDDLDVALARLSSELHDATPELGPLLQSARHALSLASGRAQARQALEIEGTYRHLLTCGERLSAALDEASLARSLAEELPRLPTQNAYVSLYADDEERALRPLLSFVEGSVAENSGAHFPAERLVPEGAFPADRRHTSFVLPLTTKSRRWGVMVMEIGSPFGVYQMLADQISASLNNLLLQREIVRRTELHFKSVQERLATAERMASLSTLAGGVAHDLNNALGPLVALPDVMLAELDEFKRDPSYDPAELRADIAAIKSTAVRASQTIKDLLTLGRKGRMNREVVDLNSLVERCLDGERVRLAARRRSGVTLRAKLAPEPLYVLGSEPHLSRAVSNLVQNALDAIDGQGRVTVSTARSLVLETLSRYETIPPGEYVTLVVEDDGQGIETALLPRLFEPFFTTKRAGEYSGSGLGLAIVHGVVKEHEGFVDVRNGPVTGTIFTLYVPLTTASPESKRSRSKAPRSAAKILVVDDEPLQLHAARRILEHLGYEVSTTASGQSAYERFADASGPAETARSPYDLVILDVMLGEEHDGLEILRRVRELFPRQRGLLMSGHAPAERGELASREGFGWLAKPFGSESLAQAVKAVLADEA